MTSANTVLSGAASPLASSAVRASSETTYSVALEGVQGGIFTLQVISPLTGKPEGLPHLTDNSVTHFFRLESFILGFIGDLLTARKELGRSKAHRP